MENHPTVTSFMANIQRWHLQNLVRIEQLLDGDQPKPKKLAYRRLNERFLECQDALFRQLNAVGDNPVEAINVAFGHLDRNNNL